VAPFVTTTTNRISEDWIDTLTGRVGFTVQQALIYGSFGVAFAGTTDTICGPVSCIANSQNRAGFAVGGGVEYAVLPNVSIKFDYLHADFGSKNFINTPVSLDGVAVDQRSVNLTDDMFRAGVNWRFYAAPVDVAKN
jgi:outer membrane immunogenic protein